MGYLLDILSKEIKQPDNQDKPPASLDILDFLSRFALEGTAIEIYSEHLKCNIWLCPDKESEAQIKQDHPGQVRYTVQEWKNILKLNPSPEDLKKIHEAKEIFPNSTIRSTNKRIKV